MVINRLSSSNGTVLSKVLHNLKLFHGTKYLRWWSGILPLLWRFPAWTFPENRNNWEEQWFHGINCEDVKVTTSSLSCLECWHHSCKLQFREFNVCKDTINKEHSSQLGELHWRKQESWRVCKATTWHFIVILSPPKICVSCDSK